MFTLSKPEMGKLFSPTYFLKIQINFLPNSPAFVVVDKLS